MQENNLSKIQADETASRIFHLNMIKLGHLLPRMKLTVEERFMLTELATAYFGDLNKVPPFPWTAAATDTTEAEHG